MKIGGNGETHNSRFKEERCPRVLAEAGRLAPGSPSRSPRGGGGQVGAGRARGGGEAPGQRPGGRLPSGGPGLDTSSDASALGPRGPPQRAGHPAGDRDPRTETPPQPEVLLCRREPLGTTVAGGGLRPGRAQESRGHRGSACDLRPLAGGALAGAGAAAAGGSGENERGSSFRSGVRRQQKRRRLCTANPK